MKYYFILISLVFLFSCRVENPPKPDTFQPDFLSWGNITNVNINGVSIPKYFQVKRGLSYLGLVINMNNTDANYYYYPLDIGVTLLKNGTYRLHSYQNSDSLCEIGYMKVCCYTNPDAIYATYNIYESDSLNNYIRVHIDSLTNTLSGFFKATMINGIPGGIEPDTVRMQCDTFYCKINF